MKAATITVFLFFTFSCPAQGDVGLTLPQNIWEANVSVIRLKSSFTDETGKQNNFSEIILVTRPGKKRPELSLQDSNDAITRYLFYNEKGNLVCDSDAMGMYTQKIKYDNQGRIIQIIRKGEHTDTINWIRKKDTVFCRRTYRNEIYFKILENKKHKPVKLYAPNPVKGLWLYGESKYDAKGFLTDEIYYVRESGGVWRHYVYQTGESGLVTRMECSGPKEPKITCIYGYEYYK